MDRLRRALPPLDPLIAFEAAARHGSFTRAADELALSQAAVSQRVRRLEEYIGAPLFDRAHRRVQLTTAGRILQHAASPALRQIAVASEEVRARGEKTQLTIAADQAVASMWLLTRLRAFRATEPDGMSIRIIASDDEAECLADGVELAIVHGNGEWPGYEAQLLFPDEVFPVCAPGYVDGRAPLASPEDLLAHALLELDDTHWHWMNWRGWLARLGVHDVARRELLRINAYPLLIEAAKAGEGVALGWRHLVDADLASGALVRPLPQSETTEFGYYLIWPSAHDLDPLAETFRAWVLGRVGHQHA